MLSLYISSTAGSHHISCEYCDSFIFNVKKMKCWRKLWLNRWKGRFILSNFWLSPYLSTVSLSPTAIFDIAFISRICRFIQESWKKCDMSNNVQFMCSVPHYYLASTARDSKTHATIVRTLMNYTPTINCHECRYSSPLIGILRIRTDRQANNTLFRSLNSASDLLARHAGPRLIYRPRRFYNYFYPVKKWEKMEREVATSVEGNKFNFDVKSTHTAIFNNSLSPVFKLLFYLLWWWEFVAVLDGVLDDNDKSAVIWHDTKHCRRCPLLFAGHTKYPFHIIIQPSPSTKCISIWDGRQRLLIITIPTDGTRHGARH